MLSVAKHKLETTHSMNRLGRLTHLVGLNAVPIAGLMWAGWSDGTALALYWCETFIVLFLVALRIRIHRKLTNKRGHFTGPNSYFSRQFLFVGLFFLLAPAIFVAVAAGNAHIDVHALGRGLLYASGFLLIGLLLDLTTIRDQPFMWVRRMANLTWWRVLLINIAGLSGVFGVGFDYPRAGVITFIALKVYTDLAANVNDYDPREAPRFMKWFTKDTKELKLEWEAEYDDRHLIYIEDEEPFDGRFSRPVTYQIKPPKKKSRLPS